MGRLAVVGGTGLRDSGFVQHAERVTIGGVPVLDAGDFVFVQRHGLDHFVLPHEIDHRSHVLAIRDAGCDRVLALSSTGSLRLDWPVGTFVCPDDFYAPQVHDSIHDDGRAHIVPGFDPDWRGRVLEVWRNRAATPIVDGGVYAQTRGPRFETRAEVRALAQVGDLVGMTIAAECVLTKEIGIAYAAVCVVDNLANGLDPTPLTIEEFRAGVLANRDALLADLAAVLPGLAGTV